MRVAPVLLALAFAFAGGGCHGVTYIAPTKMPSPRQVEHDLAFFLFGLIGVEYVNVAQDCGPPGAARIYSRTEFIDGFLGVITLGIYTPRTVTVTCAAPRSASRSWRP